MTGRASLPGHRGPVGQGGRPPATRGRPPATRSRPSATRGRPPGRGRSTRRWSRAERGSAVVEVVLLGVPLLVPLLLLAVAVATVQQARSGVADAARQAGRAWVTGTAATAGARAAGAARATLADRGVPAGAVRIGYAAAGAGCATAAADPPPLRPGAAVTVCVTAEVGVLGTRREVTGRFTARADRHRDHR